MRSTRDLKSTEAVLTIPESICLTESLAREAPTGQALAEYFASLDSPESKWNEANPLDPHAIGVLFMVAFLMHQRSQPGSFFAPYVLSLPQSYDSISLFWPEQDRRILFRNTNLNTIIEHRLAHLKDGFEHVTKSCSHLFENAEKDFTWDCFTWAYSSISSRAFPRLSLLGNVDRGYIYKTQEEAQKTEICLYPVLDMVLILFLINFLNCRPTMSEHVPSNGEHRSKTCLL